MKILKIVARVVGVIVLLMGLSMGVLWAFFPRKAAPPAVRVEATAARVTRGQYLALHVAQCVSCHSDKDESRYSFPPKDGTFGRGGQHFTSDDGLPPGLECYAANITPAALGSWSDGQIIRAMTAGIRADDRPMIPVMPYPDFQTMDLEDVYSIVAYIRSLPAIEHPVPPDVMPFPINFISRTLPQPASPQKMPSTADRIAYGGYLVKIAGCHDCHSPMDSMGQPIAGREFAGGVTFRLGGGRWVKSANLTPDPTGLGAMTEAQFVARFKAFDNDQTAQHRILAPGASQTVMPWLVFAGITEPDLKAIYAWLRTLKPVANPVQTFGTDETLSVCGR